MSILLHDFGRILTMPTRRKSASVIWRQVRVADAILDALIARGYLAADNREDAEAVDALAALLEARGLVPWLDRNQLSPGVLWPPEVVKGLRASQSCAVVVGPHGLGDWAREELAVARVEEPGAGPHRFGQVLAAERDSKARFVHVPPCPSHGLGPLAAALTLSPARRFFLHLG